ncbi:MAG: hypothetical protein ACRDSR_11680 [Pseudonocardiaceae bacterium]
MSQALRWYQSPQIIGHGQLDGSPGGAVQCRQVAQQRCHRDRGRAELDALVVQHPA